jgi:hypothetical protein
VAAAAVLQRCCSSADRPPATRAIAGLIIGVGGAGALIIGLISFCFFKRWAGSMKRRFLKWREDRKARLVGGAACCGSSLGR